MVHIVPVDRERHGGKVWRRLTDFGFMSSEVVVPVSASEFSQAVLAMPIGFIERSRTFTPVALMAAKKGSNAFVGPSGQWLGGYMPAILRCYPFSLLRSEGSEHTVLAIDEDSGRVLDEVREGGRDDVAKFFEADGTPSATTKALTDYLRILESDQALTRGAVAALAEADVIKPWALTLPIGNEQVTVSGLYCVDERALNALDDATFLKLRKASSLVIAYGQIFSMGQVKVLTHLSLVQQQMAKGPPSDMLPV
jgi:hypothetical protein